MGRHHRDSRSRTQRLPARCHHGSGRQRNLRAERRTWKPAIQGHRLKGCQIILRRIQSGRWDGPVRSTRTGDAKFEPPPKSTPITKELEGSWEGSLDVGGQILRLLVKLSNGPDGVATGTMVSVDQGGSELPVTAVVQTGSHLKLVVQSVAGTYEGDLKDGQLTGTWTQGPGTLPLIFKRPSKSQ